MMDAAGLLGSTLLHELSHAIKKGSTSDLGEKADCYGAFLFFGKKKKKEPDMRFQWVTKIRFDRMGKLQKVVHQRRQRN